MKVETFICRETYEKLCRKYKVVVPISGGYQVFKSVEDYKAWENNYYEFTGKHNA
jgi:hypothetical protein